MATQDTSKIKEDIINFLQNNGPSLPIPISRQIKIDSLFTSAFLSELLSNKRISITNMKVGGSPVYYVRGTEAGLEKYSEHLKSKEKEAYELLRENKFLIDSEQEPAIRVALRQIRDFSKPFEKEGRVIWRYFLEKEENYEKEKSPETKLSSSFINSVKRDLESQTKPKEEQIEEEKKDAKKEIQKEIFEETMESKEMPPTPIEREKPKTKELERIFPEEEKPAFKNPLAKKEVPKKSKEKPKSEFVQDTIKFIEDKGWKIIQELDYKAKEYNCLIQINSELGPIIFKTIAKDKKTISESDFTKLLGESQAIPLPALFLSKGDPQKKTNEFLEKFTSVLKFKKIE